jgi:hypothetical protein
LEVKEKGLRCWISIAKIETIQLLRRLMQNQRETHSRTSIVSCLSGRVEVAGLRLLHKLSGLFLETLAASQTSVLSGKVLTVSALRKLY